MDRLLSLVKPTLSVEAVLTSHIRDMEYNPLFTLTIVLPEIVHSELENSEGDNVTKILKRRPLQHFTEYQT